MRQQQGISGDITGGNVTEGHGNGRHQSKIATGDVTMGDILEGDDDRRSCGVRQQQEMLGDVALGDIVL